MKQCLFSSGSEQAHLMVGSDIPQQSWQKIRELSNTNPSFEGLKFQDYQVGKRTVIAFVTSPSLAKEKLQRGSNLVPSSSPTAKESFALFKSLSRKDDFAIAEAAITLFNQNLDRLSELKKQINPSKQLIITGSSLGGSIASLFTLWLLESDIFTKDKGKLLCITFGSPLIGDSSLQNTLAKFSWNSHFLHLVSDKDPVPRIFKDQNLDALKPFGTFLLCSESGCSCFEDPKTILDLLVRTAPSQEATTSQDYEPILNGLRRKALCKLNSDADSASSPFKASIISQLSAIGITATQPQLENQQRTDDLVNQMEKQERKFLMGKNKSWIISKKLPDIKTYMAYMEWYKRWSKEKETGYYDSYKRKMFKTDMDVDEFCKKLVNYWHDMVEEEEKKPHNGLFASRRFLFAATNYRRMVEPLLIAKYYAKGGRNYESKGGRDRHFILLEEWLGEQRGQISTPNDGKKKMVAENLTEDSCFWAKVEEAILALRMLQNAESSVEEKESSKQKLRVFEDYVFDSLKNYSVSPEIFLKNSSFNLWWNEYREVMEWNHNSNLTNFMNNRKYDDYAKGEF